MSLLDRQLSVLAQHFEDADTTEIVVNRPGAYHVEDGAGWHEHRAAWLTAGWLDDLAAKLKASDGSIATDGAPILSGTLANGARVHLVRPPAIESADVAAVTIRIPSRAALTHAELVEGGLYELMPGRDLDLLHAVTNRQRIFVSGPTGSGKTTLLRALAQEIARTDRILTVEGVRELRLPDHPNRVHLLHDEERTGGVTAADLVQAAMRMRPDWLVMGEIRSGVAFDFVNAVTAGVEGALATIHAAAAPLAVDRMLMLFQQSRAGGNLADATAERLIRSSMDVVVQMAHVRGRGRRITEIWEVAR